MDTTSVWRANAPRTAYPPLPCDTSTDVLVIGGGITGCTTALLLARAGRSVVLLEGRDIGGGATGNSTGNLYETLSRGLAEIRSKWGDEVAREVAMQRRNAIGFIESIAQGAQDCGFRRCEHLLYATAEAQRGSILSEYEAIQAAGSDVRLDMASRPGLPAPVREAVVIANQAQLQPQGYVVHVARLAAEAGAVLHENSPVVSIDWKARTASTAAGTVRAAEIVLATHTPAGFHPVQAEMPVHREYGIARAITGNDPGPGIFWWRGNEHLSVRTVDTPRGTFLVCVGQEFKTGDHNATAALMALEQLAAQELGAADTAWRWSAQNFRSADGLPYIGRDIRGAWIATGFGTDGLTWGTVAAHLIADGLAGRTPAFADLCKPGRFSPVKGGKTIAEEVGTMARAYVKDYLTHRQDEALASLAPGDSAIVKTEGETFAAYRAPDGELFAVSPVCTHMGCKVHWNSVETSWDCPCHGSRFGPDGSVIEGPAIVPLKRKHIRLGVNGGA